MNIHQLETTARALAGGSPEEKNKLSERILAEAEGQGLYFGSVAPAYQGMARGAYSGFTVPAVNLRGLVFDIARAAFQAAKDIHAGPFMFEIAPSELVASQQTFREFAGEILEAALAEGWRGPIFLQGDHFPIASPDPATIATLVQTCNQAVQAGFYQVDIDASDLVKKEGGTAEQQQRVNAEVTAQAILQVRRSVGNGNQVLFGGEVGQIGGELTTEADLRAFLTVHQQTLAEGAEGIGKVSVNTGTQHGGAVDQNGRVGRMPVNFELAATLSQIARKEYGLPGVVQHGASTMGLDQLARLPGCGVNEVHLATAIQNIVFDHPAFPRPLLKTMQRELTGHAADSTSAEKPAPEGGEFGADFYHERWLAWGRYKSELWNLPEPVKAELRRSLSEWFRQVFQALNLGGMDWLTQEIASQTGARTKR